MSKGLNVFVGANGTGKSHILKLLYASIRSVQKSTKGQNEIPSKVFLEKEVADRLIGVFQPDSLGRLTRRNVGKNRSEIKLKLHNQHLDFSFSTGSKERVTIDTLPVEWISSPAVFLPTRELLSIYPNFVSTYETTTIPFEETWRDLAILLGKGLAKGAQQQNVADILSILEGIMGGKLILEGDRFYLKSSRGKMEMYLLAEGLRKAGTIARLIANHSITGKSYLFWDEPEANLNAKIIRDLAKVIMQLVQMGVQIFIATHSLFLLRELHLLKATEFKNCPSQYFGLNQDEDEIKITSGKTMDDIGNITSLDYQTEQDEDLLNYYM